MEQKNYRRLVIFAVFLAFSVILLGAYTRLADAGLGCPDWPGCYGYLTVPQSESEVTQAEQLYPQRAVEAGKAWKEMVHRYFAGTLGLVIFMLAVLALRANSPGIPRTLPIVLVIVVIFQALLGMYTVTLLLKPVVVMGHLLGGFLTFSLLVWLLLAVSPQSNFSNRSPGPILLVALVILVMQIALGGWTSANYAALACTDFPMCHGQWLPEADFAEGFILWRGIGVNYEFGVLEHPARTAIHLAHRIGAVLTLFVVGFAALRLTLSGERAAKLWGLVLATLLLVQILLGISNVVFHLPLFVAVLHNGVAALLLITLVTINYKLRVSAK